MYKSGILTFRKNKEMHKKKSKNFLLFYKSLPPDF